MALIAAHHNAGHSGGASVALGTVPPPPTTHGLPVESRSPPALLLNPESALNKLYEGRMERKPYTGGGCGGRHVGSTSLAGPVIPPLHHWR